MKLGYALSCLLLLSSDEKKSPTTATAFVLPRYRNNNNLVNRANGDSDSSRSNNVVRPSSSLLSLLDDDDDDNNSNSNVGEATERLGGIQQGPTVWTEFGRMAEEVGADQIANLGQGFPDWAPPKFAVDSLVEAATDPKQHQYTRPEGHPSLVRELAKRYSIHLDRDIDPMNEVAVTVGASQALYMTLQTVLKPGDEVILFEPFFDLYVNQIKLAGGTPVYVPLRFVPYDSDDSSSSGNWVLDADALNSRMSPRTKAIILNSPHNPTGKIFTANEMDIIAESVGYHNDCVVISDEVYKYIVHAPPKDDDDECSDSEEKPCSSLHLGESPICDGHIHFASLPGMYDRTMTISSAGKTFSATGWQVGWCIGPSRLVKRVHQLLPYVQFCASTLVQDALAKSLPKADLPYEGYKSYYHYLKETYLKKRNMLGKALTEAGFGIPDYDRTPGGGFFILARVDQDTAQRIMMTGSDKKDTTSSDKRRDWELCEFLLKEKGILCIPSSPFFSKERVDEGASDEFIRIAFCKTDETIENAATKFQEILKSLPKKEEESRLLVEEKAEN